MSAKNSEIASIGWIEPISLFTAMMETRIVSGRIKPANASTSTKPFLSTGAKSTSNP
ncbi:Uncharacterised protein [Streptococcus pneumoniae]|nr:Uncharacterised protein [Streptococcus pneumoniae]